MTDYVDTPYGYREVDPEQDHLWIWFGLPDVGAPIMLAVITAESGPDGPMYRPLISTTREQAERQADLAVAAGAGLQLTPQLREFRLIATHEPVETPGSDQ